MGNKADWPFHAKKRKYLREHGRMNTSGWVEGSIHVIKKNLLCAFTGAIPDMRV